MKKTLAAVAVLGAFAGSAIAADVTLYGVVDLGLNYAYQKVGDASSTNTFSERTGQNSGSRFGLKGVEDLGNGYKVGFLLENGFKADDGTLDQNGRLFGREAILYVNGNFGTLAFGRTGALTAGTGSYNLVKNSVFSTGWGQYTGSRGNFWLGDRDRMDNTITYVTPSFAGFQVSAQYSFNRNGQEAEGNEAQNERYAALGASYKNGGLYTAVVVDSVLNKNTTTNTKDSLGLTLSTSYDFGFVKPYFQAQYGKHENRMGVTTSQWDSGAKTAAGTYPTDYFKVGANKGYKGYALNLGATAPALGGTFYVQASYLDGESEGDFAAQAGDTAADTTFSVDQKNWGFAAGYAYPLSKRTFVYTFASYNQLKTKWTEDGETDSEKTKQGEFGLGIVHSF